MAENVKVVVRCRPMNEREKDVRCKKVVKMDDCMVETWDPNEIESFPKQFTFDSVYDETAPTESIYNDICFPLVESVLEGYNSTIFVYGQTGCGKSYTMEGLKGSEKGIISRAFEHIFETIAVTTGAKYLALLSYLEIYNEQIRDLLLPCAKSSLNSTLVLNELPNEGVKVSGLTTHPVHNVAECEHFLSIGAKNRSIGATLMNQSSSRSHSILTISIEQLTNVNSLNNNECIRKGKLNLVDLAGSERQAKTGTTGDRFKEATKINLSLSALGNVISALVDGKAKHIPYRDSKLTRLLQDSLGGNTRTLMVACVSPSDRDYSETLSTLRYANRAKNISNKPKVNEDPKDAMLRQYQQEILQLRSLLEARQETPPKAGEQAEELRKSQISQMELLRKLHESERNEKELVLQQIEDLKKKFGREAEKPPEEGSKAAKVSNEEILDRIRRLKGELIGGERAGDKELSERRRKKKMASEKRLNALATVLSKIEMDEDRELLQNQYKDISVELNSKNETLKKYRNKVKLLEREITDLQSEFESEREDYLEAIRRQDISIKLLSQISEKVANTLKKECNYRDLDTIKEQAVWLDDKQTFKLPEVVIHHTKLPPAGNRTSSGNSDNSKNSSGSPSPNNDKAKEDIICSYFRSKRAEELLNQSSRAFNAWKDFTNRSRLKLNEDEDSAKSPNGRALSNSYNGMGSFWINGNALLSPETTPRRPLRLEALPAMVKRLDQRSLNRLDLI